MRSCASPQSADRSASQASNSEEPLELGLRGGDRNDVEAAAVVRAVLGGGLGRVDLQQDEHGFYLSSADMRGDQKKIRVSMSTGKTLSLIDIL